MTNNEVIAAFMAGQFGKASSLTSSGGGLWSYDYLLALWPNERDRVILFEKSAGWTLRGADAAFSPTTNGHRRLVERACNEAGVTIERITDDGSQGCS